MSVSAQVNERLEALTEAGVSIWLDQIRRSLIETGELERMVREDSLRGVTSNPAIFEKAILGSPDYDAELAELAGQGLGPREIYDEIAIKDVQLAADVLRPVWEEADHADGFVSLEVSGHAAPGFALREQLAALYRARTRDRILYLKADSTLPFGVLEKAMVAARDAGVRVVGGLTERRTGRM